MEDPWASPWAAEPATRLPHPSSVPIPPDAPRQTPWPDAWDSDWHVAPSHSSPAAWGDTQPPSSQPQETQPEKTQPEKTQPHESSAPRAALFPVDLSHLDALFPSDAQPRRLPDTTTDISANQTWRRVSRFGSSRRHNGDGECARVSWAESRVRARTLATLRRWVSEDSACGLARRTDAPSLFNWDSPAPPVSIGELLRRRRRSLTSSPSPVPVPVPAAKRPVSMIQLAARPSPSKLRAESVDEPRTEDAHDELSKMAVDDSRSAQTPVDNDGDDDDDWGDMVVAEGPVHVIAGALSEDEQVAGILRSLPDLSYMLR